MALKKTNYELKEHGIILPEAYAFIHKIECERCAEIITEEVNGELPFRQVDKLKGVAEFYIQNAPRESAMGLKPFEKHIVHFTCKANENPMAAAYIEAKGTHIVKEYNPKIREFEDVEKPNLFNGWEDDIVVE
nr:MAG TPA: hypothetical protein [Caudoviricetes sp.]